MANLLRLLPDDVFKKLENEAIVSVVLSLQKNKKVVTGSTARSVEARTELAQNTSFGNIVTTGGGGLPFFTKPKPPNTKLPLKKVGDRFELVPDLKDWKASVGFGGNDYVLARAIAKNPRPAVDIATEAQKIFLKRAGAILPAALAVLIGKELKEDFEDKK